MWASKRGRETARMCYGVFDTSSENAIFFCLFFSPLRIAPNRNCVSDLWIIFVWIVLYLHCPHSRDPIHLQRWLSASFGRFGKKKSCGRTQLIWFLIVENCLAFSFPCSIVAFPRALQAIQWLHRFAHKQLFDLKRLMLANLQEILRRNENSNRILKKSTHNNSTCAVWSMTTLNYTRERKLICLPFDWLASVCARERERDVEIILMRPVHSVRNLKYFMGKLDAINPIVLERAADAHQRNNR